MYFLMERGLYDEIKAFNGHIIGICGGYQMLGQRVLDPNGVESAVKEAVGLGLLPVETEMLPEKETHQALAYLDEGGLRIAPDCSGVVSGYEIHMGRTTHLGTPRPFARIFRRGEASETILDGTVSDDGRVFGTYLHGIFDNEHLPRDLPQRHPPGKGDAAATQKPCRTARRTPLTGLPTTSGSTSTSHDCWTSAGSASDLRRTGRPCLGAPARPGPG